MRLVPGHPEQDFLCHPERSEGSVFHRTTKRSLALRMTIALLATGACASVSRPPGGPVDTDPPDIIGGTVDTNATNFDLGRIEVRFDEVIAEKPVGVSGTAQAPASLESVVL